MSTALAVVTGREVVTEQDLDILRTSMFKNFEDHEIAYCVRFANSVALSPLLKQINFVRRRNKDGTFSISAQTAIDGFRLTAQRAGGYAGNDDAIYKYAPNDQTEKKPLKATVTVYRIVDGQKCSFTGSVRWEEFYSPLGGQWDRMPHVMLGKCAEAQALRKAFPAELSHLYANEEMDQADKPGKAEKIQKELAPTAPQEKEPIVVESQTVPAHNAESPVCINCQSDNLMVSRYDENTLYCKDCKKTQER